MPILPLTLNPDPLLRDTIAEVSDITNADIQQLIADMRVTMVAAQGVGLAANQVGRNIRIFTIDKGIAKKAGISDVFVNPVLEEMSQKTAVLEEGCLSVPGKFDDVRRAAEVTMRALDEHGNPFRVEASGFLARVLQHELDHLNGALFIDRLA